MSESKIIVQGICPNIHMINLIFRQFYHNSDTAFELEYELVTDEDVANVGLDELIGELRE